MNGFVSGCYLGVFISRQSTTNRFLLEGIYRIIKATGHDYRDGAKSKCGQNGKISSSITDIKKRHLNKTQFNLLNSEIST